MQWELLIHAGEVIAICAAAWKIIRVANRILDVLRDFPPHRHVNGIILYPDGYEPTPVGRIDV